jgi:flagellin-like protein
VYADDRGATEVIGTILLVAIVVVSVTVLSAATLLTQSEPSDPFADLTGTVSDSKVFVNHTGGEGLDAGNLRVVARGGGAEYRERFPDGAITGDGDGRFEPGETWKAMHATPAFDDGTRVRLLVVHDDRHVLLDVTSVAGTA